MPFLFDVPASVNRSRFLRLFLGLAAASLQASCGGGSPDPQRAVGDAGGLSSAGHRYGYVLGDSTAAAYLGYSSVASYLPDTRTVVDLSRPGDTIALQKARWQALGRVDPAAVDWVVVQIGLNDLDPAVATTTTIAALQDLVATVGASIGNGGGKLLLSAMIPCHQRQLDVYGEAMGAIAYRKWLDINDAIAGRGATPVTGVYARISAHVAQLGDAANNLLPEYDHGDHVHENDAGRRIVAKAWADGIDAVR